MALNFFCANSKTFVFNFAFSFFLYLLTNKARKLEVAESNPFMENILISPSLSVG